MTFCQLRLPQLATRYRLHRFTIPVPLILRRHLRRLYIEIHKVCEELICNCC